VQDTVGEVIVAIPKPRGEGTWAWCRYWLIAIRSAYRSQYVCAQVGCSEVPTSHPWIEPTSSYCKFHSTPEQAEMRHKQYMEQLSREPVRPAQRKKPVPATTFKFRNCVDL